MPNPDTFAIRLGSFRGNEGSRTTLYAHIPMEHAKNREYIAQIEALGKKAVRAAKAEFKANPSLTKQRVVTFCDNGDIRTQKNAPVAKSTVEALAAQLRTIKETIKPSDRTRDGGHWTLEMATSAETCAPSPPTTKTVTLQELEKRGLEEVDPALLKIDKQVKRNIQGIRQSLQSVPDSEYTVTINAQDQKVFVEYLHNSDFKDKYYEDEEGKIRQVPSDAITPSFYDGQKKHATMVRRLKAKKNASAFCHTGRIDTEEKAEEYFRWLIEGLSSQDKQKFEAQDGHPAQTLTVLVDCLMTYAVEKSKITAERQLFERIRNRREYSFTAENGQTYRFKVNPILIPHQANHISTGTLEKIFPEETVLSGKGILKTIAREAFKNLVALIIALKKKDGTAEFPNFEETLQQTGIDRNGKIIKREAALTAPDKAQKIAQLLKNILEDKITEEEYTASIFLLSQLLEQPYIVHCKSSVDRTGPMVALTATLYDYTHAKDGSLQLANIPTTLPKIREMIYGEDFKNRFSAHIIAESKHTSISRGVPGYKWDLMGVKVLPVLVRMLPKRYLSVPKMALWVGLFSIPKTVLRKFASAVLKPGKVIHKKLGTAALPLAFVATIMWAIIFSAIQFLTFALQTVLNFLSTCAIAPLLELCKNFKKWIPILTIAILSILFGPFWAVAFAVLLLTYFLIPTKNSFIDKLCKHKFYGYHFFGMTVKKKYRFYTQEGADNETKIIRLMYKK